MATSSHWEAIAKFGWCQQGRSEVRRKRAVCIEYVSWMGQRSGARGPAGPGNSCLSNQAYLLELTSSQATWGLLYTSGFSCLPCTAAICKTNTLTSCLAALPMAVQTRLPPQISSLLSLPTVSGEGLPDSSCTLLAWGHSQQMKNPRINARKMTISRSLARKAAFGAPTQGVRSEAQLGLFA